MQRHNARQTRHAADESTQIVIRPCRRNRDGQLNIELTRLLTLQCNAVDLQTVDIFSNARMKNIWKSFWKAKKYLFTLVLIVLPQVYMWVA